MHGSGLKIVLDPSFWASLEDEVLTTADNIGALSDQGLSVTGLANQDLTTPQGDAVIHYLPELHSAAELDR